MTFKLKKLSKNPKVAILIATLNEEEHIGALIDSISENSYKNKEVIVVDDGSKDKTIEIAKKKGAIVLINNPGRRGPAFGRNKAAKYTNAKIIGSMDADCYLEDKKYIEKCVKEFDEKTIALYTAFHTIQEKFIEKIVTNEFGVSLEPRFVRRDIYLNLGGFPEIGFGEDQLYKEKIELFAKENNLKTKTTKKAFFSGHGVHSIKELYKQAKWYGKTGVPFLNHFSGIELVKQVIAVYLRLIYLISFTFFCLYLIFNYIFLLIFSIPFIVIVLSIVIHSIKAPFHIFRIITYLIFGIGLIHGLLLYLFNIDKKQGA